MGSVSLAVKYRPNDWDAVVEQTAVKEILMEQLNTDTFKHGYLFCGGAGTGKTTCARIFANAINHGQGNPIEIDAASNNGVDAVRELSNQAKTKSLDSEYKVFIIDECHMISASGWAAMLKLIEEPPAKSIFIFATTDPQKIPNTILSRVQRYDFHRISHSGVIDRLEYILEAEKKSDNNLEWDPEALDYLAKIADGGMRDAITLMDKCLSYSKNLTVEHITIALGTVNYDCMFDLLEDITVKTNVNDMIQIIETVYRDGLDLKQFIKDFMNMVLDVLKYKFTNSFDYVRIPNSYKFRLDDFHAQSVYELLDTLIQLNSDIKWDTSPKASIEAVLVSFILKEKTSE